MNDFTTRDLRVRLVMLLAGAVFTALPVEGDAQTLPAGWTLRTIGVGVTAGRATYSGGTFTVEGAGLDIWGATDQFSYVYQQITGDVTIVARVTSLENTHAWAKGGVMIRESLAAGARHAYALVSASRGLAFQRRSTTGASTMSTAGGRGNAPVWLRLERRSSTFTASRSADGITWTRIGSSTTISMGSSVYVGLAVTSHGTTRATARFASVQVTRPLPTGWSAADIGTPAIRGSVSYANSAFTVRGAGADIWGTSDQFTFAYRQVSGDVDIVARVSSLQSAHAWTKAGVMVRASLRRDASHASMFVSGSRGRAFQRRPGTGLSSLHTSGGTGGVPVWVKLERRGTTVTAFRSADGTTWQMIGSETLTLPTTFFVGLAVTSHDTSAAASGVFSNVSVRAAQAPGNTPPSVSLTAPAAGAVFVAPASIALRATASDLNGSIARVEFFRGTTLIGTDTSSPYGVTWRNVSAGSYRLTAVAVDNAGASTTSTARTVIVSNTAPPTTAVFNPSPDHNTSRVTSYRLEIFAAGADPARTSAIAVQNLGKPAIARGECSANIAATIIGLPSGSYFATVRAIGPNGASPRAVSDIFGR